MTTETIHATRISNSTEKVEAMVRLIKAGNMTILVDGIVRRVVGIGSSGPGCMPHTYELAGRDYIYEVAGEWKLQRPGQFPAVVEVSLS